MAAPQAKPHADRTNLARTGKELPKTDVVVNGGDSAVEMTPAVPARNTPTAALTDAERSLPVVAPPKVPTGKK